MTKNGDAISCSHPGRAVAKIILLLFCGVLLAWGAVGLIDESFLDQLKFDLSLVGLIGLVVAINLISVLFFVLLYILYQWVRADLKAPSDLRGDLIDGLDDRV